MKNNRLLNNRGLKVGDIITEQRSVKQKQKYEFEIIAVLNGEFLCEYISEKPVSNRTFYWQMKDSFEDDGVLYFE